MAVILCSIIYILINFVNSLKGGENYEQLYKYLGGVSKRDCQHGGG